MTDGAHVLPAAPERWLDVETVFGTRGDAAHCWCQWFKLDRAAFEFRSDDELRTALQRQVAGGRTPGVVAYRDGEPAGWCAVESRSAYPQLLRRAETGGAEEGDVWSVTCFVLRPAFRRRGVAGDLLDAAVEHARAGGASAVEAYAVDVERRTRVAASELYHGPLSLFLAHGFEVVSRTSKARAVVRRDLAADA